MKKMLILLGAIFIVSLIVGCSENESDTTLDAFIQAYVDQGIDVDKNEKPIFTMVDAVDGVIFYVDNNKVAIYEYNSAKDLKKAQKNNPLIEGWEFSGRFLLETNNEQAINIFTSVE